MSYTYTRFFHKTLLWLPRGRRPLRVPLMMPLSMRALSKRINFCKLHTFSFFGPVSVFFAQEGPPNEFFCTFFGRVFGPARVQISNVPLLRSVFFCSVEKVRSKDPIGYAAWGLPQGPAFACTLTILNKTKKQKLKKTQVLLGIVISNKHFCPRCENTKCLFDIRIQNKTCVFLVFAFLFC